MAIAVGGLLVRSDTILLGKRQSDRGIYEWAVQQAGVRFEDCLYVDDSREEAEAARRYGMKSFWIDRSHSHNGEWIVPDLRGLVKYDKGKRA